LDGDEVTYRRDITVTGGVGDQRYWMYFLPSVSKTGLADISNGGQLNDLQQELPVSLTKDGKAVAPLRITQMATSVDPVTSNFSTRRGTKFIVAVGEGRSPAWNEYQAVGSSGVLGIMEDVQMVTIRPDGLPENPIGLVGVDAILWMNADPAVLKRGGDEKMRALQAYVRQGGTLVILQSPEWQRAADFGDLLPVVVQGVEEKDTLDPLIGFANPDTNLFGQHIVNPSWNRPKGPFKFARAMPKTNAIVDEWMTWDDAGKDKTPYIVRAPYGLGSLVWVAQDLSDPNIATRASTGWPYVWEKVFDWRNTPMIVTPKTSQDDREKFALGPPADLGRSLLSGIELNSKTAKLITIAIGFFVVYWLIAGPGLYGYLVTKKQSHLSWFLFGATALAATLLTVLIFRLVVRGPPEMRHVSVVRAAQGEPVTVYSRFGLYIPRDGDQKIEMKDVAPNSISMLNSFAIHPKYVTGDASQVIPQQYSVNVGGDPAEGSYLIVPYRSTLKKFEARWTGDMTKRIEGSGKLVAKGAIEGSLTNGTDKKFKNIYIGFKYPQIEEGFPAGDWLLYIPSWDPGVTLDLNKEFNQSADKKKGAVFLNMDLGNFPEKGVQVMGRINMEWENYWFAAFQPNQIGDIDGDDSGHPIRRSFPMLSFYDRLTPQKRDQTHDRIEVLRRGARMMDCSASLAAGQLVVIAEVDEEPLPFPLEVDGEETRGSGTTFYQFILPLDHSIASKPPTTEPASEPTTQQSTQLKPETSNVILSAATDLQIESDSRS
ncbi:MAG TPA: hypothetical protein VL282_10790, partial [Tepidisphaeraceae bacterium]|nr:hypothetical protein [Tepidisphaeraceae bacterium]